MRRGFQYLLLSAMLLPGLWGCSGSSAAPNGSIQGTVTLKGVPLDYGTIQFFSPGTGAGGIADIGADGRYQLEELPVGQYQVQVRPPVAAPGETVAPSATSSKNIPIPKDYHNYSSSGLEANVSSGENDFNANLN